MGCSATVRKGKINQDDVIDYGSHIASASVTTKDNYLSEFLYKNLQKIDKPDRKLLWIETIYNEMLDKRDPLPPSFKFVYSKDNTRVEALKDRNYNSFNWSPQELIINLMTIYDDLDYLNKYQITPDKLQCFLWIVSANYYNNPFHNFTHGFSVTQFIFSTFGLTDNMSRFTTGREQFALMVASVAHDIGHPGVNNNFLINSSDELALRYNDISVLENHHASSLFKILDFTSWKILECFSEPDQKALRKIMITAILATDMAKHGQVLSNFQEACSNFDIENEGHRQAFLDMMLHSADLNNQTLRFDLAKEWSLRVVTEFKEQAKKEEVNQLPVSEFMKIGDDVALFKKNQINIIDFVILPLWRAIADGIPELAEIVEAIRMNRIEWSDLKRLLN